MLNLKVKKGESWNAQRPHKPSKTGSQHRFVAFQSSNFFHFGEGEGLRRFLLVPLLPLLAALWMVGWVMYVVGERKETKR